MKKQVRTSFRQWLPGSGRRGSLVLGLLGLAPAAFGQVSFSSPAVYGTGGDAPFEIVLGDVNGDGRLDIVVSNQYIPNNTSHGSVGVLLAQATPVGSFAPAVAYSTTGSGRTMGIALGDVNGDGRLDMVATSQLSATISVLLNSATAPGTFTTSPSYVTYGTLNFLALGDLNGDGRLDIVAPDSNSNQVYVLLGSTTAGSFNTKVSYSIGNSGPEGTVIADVTGDGRPDIITGNDVGPQVSVLAGSATAPGTFLPGVAYGDRDLGTIGVSVGDVNKDGKPDIVTANRGTNTVGVLLATAGGFAPAVTYSCPNAHPDFVKLGDINGDGWLDIVANNHTTKGLSIFLGNPTQPGTFAPELIYPTTIYPLGVALGDLNGDQRLDMVAASGVLNVLLNTGIPLASAATSPAPELALYPNPTQGAFTVLMPTVVGATSVQAELLNALGQIVRRQQAALASSATSFTVETAGLAPGVYTVRLQAGPTSLTRRLTIQ